MYALTMSALERRIQLLLDDARYERVAAEAERRGASVNSVIRSAIDLAFPSLLEERRNAVTHLLEFSSAEPADLEDAAWSATRDAMEQELAERFE